MYPDVEAVFVFQSTSPVRGTTDIHVHALRARDISIHVPRAGDDIRAPGGGGLFPKFQSTSPVRGTTASIASCHGCSTTFQSTSPVRGTTSSQVENSASLSYFNPRPPCGGRQQLKYVLCTLDGISIHVPRAGDDKATSLVSQTSPYFNPRPPCGGRQQKLPETGSQFRAASAKTGARAGRSWGKRACFARKSRQKAVRRHLGKSEHLPLAPGGQAGGGSFRRQTGFIRSSCRAV